MGGPATNRYRYNEFSIRMAHRQYYMFHNIRQSFGFDVKIKFYMEGKISKWFEDENRNWERIELKIICPIFRQFSDFYIIENQSLF